MTDRRELIFRTEYSLLTVMISVQVYNAVRNGPGLAEAKSFCTKLATDCIADIEKLPDGPAKTSLIKLAGHLRY